MAEAVVAEIEGIGARDLRRNLATGRISQAVKLVVRAYPGSDAADIIAVCRDLAAVTLTPALDEIERPVGHIRDEVRLGATLRLHTNATH